ncbi:MAG: diacylglycerol/lipid kinase family protein [Acidimicrobiia bacterium]
MRLLLVVNPTASSVSPGIRAAIADALSVHHELDVAETSARNHAATLAGDAATAGKDAVVVLAGDGTLNEAAQGLAGTSTALAPLPGGSTNVFARTLGIAHEPLDACAQLLQSLDACSTRRIGVGVGNGGSGDRRFLFHLGAGFDAATVHDMEERHAHLKRHLAHPAFALATVETWLRRYDRTTRITVTPSDRDGTPWLDAAAAGPYAVVSNSDPYTYVGRRRVTISRDAALDRALAVTVFRTLRVSLLLRAVASGVARARFVTSTPDIAQLADVWRVALTSDVAFPWQVDGDHLGSTTELSVRYEPDALTLVVPRTPSAPARGRR